MRPGPFSIGQRAEKSSQTLVVADQCKRRITLFDWPMARSAIRIRSPRFHRWNSCPSTPRPRATDRFVVASHGKLEKFGSRNVNGGSLLVDKKNLKKKRFNLSFNSWDFDFFLRFFLTSVRFTRVNSERKKLVIFLHHFQWNYSVICTNFLRRIHGQDRWQKNEIRAENRRRDIE